MNYVPLYHGRFQSVTHLAAINMVAMIMPRGTVHQLRKLNRLQTGGELWGYNGGNDITFC
jgi:hypothetical protein